MNVYYALENVGGPAWRRPSILLDGVSLPFTLGARDWRKEDAIPLLRDLEFKGDVLVPSMPHEIDPHSDVDAFRTWHLRKLERATAVAFWFAYNVAWKDTRQQEIITTLRVHSGKMLIGWPEGMDDMPEIRATAEQAGIPLYRTLPDLITHVVERANAPTGTR